MNNLYLLIFAIVPFILPTRGKRIATVVVVCLITLFYTIVALNELCGLTIGANWLSSMTLTPFSSIFVLILCATFLPILFIFRDSPTQLPPQLSLFYSSVIVLLVSVVGVMCSISGGQGEVAAIGQTQTEISQIVAVPVANVLSTGVWNFIINWELMGLSSFALLMLGSQRREYLHSAVLYFIAMHVGFVFILSGFMSVGSSTALIFGKGSMGLLPWLLFIVGFGLKSALFPFHFWLPRTYGSSLGVGAALMACSSTNMGVFGIITVTYYTQNVELVSLILIALGLVSTIYGAFMMIKSNTLSGVLSYSSIENVGLIVFGIGLSFYAKSQGLNEVALLAIIAAVLKCFSHSISKASLFSATATVVRVVGDDTISNLGGLWRKLPFTASLFTMGSMSLSSVPLFGSFIAEFLLFFVLFKSIAIVELSIIAVLGIIVVALAAASTIFNLTKSLGLTFLGHSRQQIDYQGVESRGFGTILGIAMLVTFASVGCWALVYLFFERAELLFAIEASNLAQIWEILTKIGYVFLLLVLIVALLYVVRRLTASKRANRVAPTWGCAYSSEVAPMAQYSSESFSEEASLVVAYPRSTLRNSRATLRRKISPMRIMRRWTARLALFQTGQTSHYVMHIIWFLALVLILTLCSVL